MRKDAAGTAPATAFEGAAWIDLVTRATAFPRLSETVLLHAGPPYRGTPPAPVLNAAIQALLFERLAVDEGHARQLLGSGAIRLEPAQDHGIATPLAQVVSASMWLVVVRHHDEIGYGAMLEGSNLALRFGSRDPLCRERLRGLGERLTSHLRSVLMEAQVPLVGVIRAGVEAGDDCHSRTSTANDSLIRNLRALDRNTAATLTAIPAFVLPVLMAGAVAALRHHHCALLAVGGNGEDFGVRRRGETTWRRIPARPPEGRVEAACMPLPAIGDSVLVDFCGLGAQQEDPRRREALSDPVTGILDPARFAGGAAASITATAATLVPLFNLAILDSLGERGLIGRGTYCAPAEIFLE